METNRCSVQDVSYYHRNHIQMDCWLLGTLGRMLPLEQRTNETKQSPVVLFFFCNAFTSEYLHKNADVLFTLVEARLNKPIITSPETASILAAAVNVLWSHNKGTLFWDELVGKAGCWSGGFKSCLCAAALVTSPQTRVSIRRWWTCLETKQAEREASSGRTVCDIDLATEESSWCYRTLDEEIGNFYQRWPDPIFGFWANLSKMWILVTDSNISCSERVNICVSSPCWGVLAVLAGISEVLTATRVFRTGWWTVDLSWPPQKHLEVQSLYLLHGHHGPLLMLLLRWDLSCLGYRFRHISLLILRTLDYSSTPRSIHPFPWRFSPAAFLCSATCLSHASFYSTCAHSSAAILKLPPPPLHPPLLSLYGGRYDKYIQICS